jgi:hypothetical protein
MPKVTTNNQGQLSFTFSAEEILAAQQEVAAANAPRRGRKSGITNDTFRRLLGYLRDNGATSALTAQSLIDISYHSGLGLSSIVKASRDLENRGVLVVERGGGAGNRNKYYINF